jgi:hypothetical protein
VSAHDHHKIPENVALRRQDLDSFGETVMITDRVHTMIAAQMLGGRRRTGGGPEAQPAALCGSWRAEPAVAEPWMRGH